MKMPRFTPQDRRRHFRSFRLLSRAACRHGKFVVLLAGSPLLVAGTLHAASVNDAWSTTPTDNTFTGINWNAGTTTPTAPPTSSILTTDSLYFGTSSITSLNYNEPTTGFNLSGITFNSGASAYTFSGNTIALTSSGTGTGNQASINNSSTSLQTFNNAINITDTVGSSGLTTTVGGGNLLFNGNLTLTVSGTTSTYNLVNGAGMVTLAGVDTIAGSSSGRYIRLNTGGTLLITGATTVNMSNNDIFAVAGNSTLTVAAGGTLNTVGTVGFDIANSGASAGTGTFNVNGTANFAATAPLVLGTGGAATVNLNSGGVLVTAAGLTSAGSAVGFNLNGGTLRANAAGLTLLSNSANLTVTTSSAASTIDANGFATTVASVVKDGATPGGLTIIDSSAAKGGSVTLSGANTYTGGTTVNSGTLQLTGSLAASSALTLGGGTLSYAPTVANSTQTLSGTTLNAGNSAVNVPTAGNTLNLGAITHNAGGLVNFGTGGGTITTSSAGANGIVGPYAYIGTGTGLSYVAPGGAVAAYTGGTTTTDATGVTDTTGTVNYNVPLGGTVGAGASANTLRYTGAGDTINGPVTLNGLMNAGTGALTFSGAVAAGSTNELVVLSNGQNITLNGALGNNGANAVSLTYGGPTAGTLTLTGTNTYTGATTLGGGIINVGSAGALGTSGTLNLTGGTLQYSAANTTDYSGRFSTAAGQAYNIDTNGQNVTYATALTSSGGSLNKLGAGTLTLSGANTYAGATGISAGTLQLGNGTTTGSLSTASAITNNGALVFNRSNAVTQGTDFSAASITGTGSLTQAGSGNLTLTNNAYTGATTINAGTITLTGGGNGSPGALPGTPTITVNSGGTLVLTNADTLGYVIGKDVLTINSGGQVLNNSTALRDTIYNTLTMTGGILGGTSAGDATAVYSITTPQNTNALLATSDASGTPAQITATKVNLGNPNEIFTINRGVAAPVADMIISSALNGANGFTKSGTGVLSLTGASVFTGDVAISAGTLSVDAAGANGGASSALGLANATKNVTVASGATLAFTTANAFGNGTQANGTTGVTTLPTITLNGGTLSSTRYQPIGQLNLNGATVTTNDTTDTGGYQTYELRGNVTVGGTAPSTITSSAVGVTGGVVNQGGIHIGTFFNNAVVPTTFTVAATGGAGADLTVNAPLIDESPDFGSRPGALTKAGAGTMLLTATNTYTGVTTVNAGMLSVASGGTLGSGAITVNSGGTLLTSGTGTLGNGASVTVAGTGVLTLGNSVSLNSNQVLTFAEASTINLGTSANTLASIVDSNETSVVLAPGTYTAAQLDSDFETGITTFTGLGTLTITAVPEPSTWVAGCVMISLLGLSRYRKLNGWLRSVRG